MKRTNEGLDPNAWGNPTGHHAPTPGGVPTQQAGAPNTTTQTQGVAGAPGTPGAPRMLGYPALYATTPGHRDAPLDLLRQQLGQFGGWGGWGGFGMWHPFAAQAIPLQYPDPAGSLPYQTAPEIHARPTPSPYMDHNRTSGNPPSRYTRDRLFETSELHLATASAKELDDLARWLPECRQPVITLDGNEAATVAVVLHAMRSMLTKVLLTIECSMDRFAPELISRLTALLKSQTPLTSLRLVLRDGDGNHGKFVLDQAFLKALLGHQHLEDIHLDFNEHETIWLHDPQQLADRVRDNGRLRTLNFTCCGELHKLFKAIAPGLEGNRGIHMLSLRYSSMRGCGPALASVLKTNQTLKHLDLQFTADWGAGDLQQIVEAMVVNTGVEQFYFFHAREEWNSRTKNEPRALGTAIGAMLTSNQHLKALSIHCKLDLANLTPIRQGLNANTGLQSLDLGYITGMEDSEGTTDAGDAINELFATNSRLASVTLRPPGNAETKDVTVGIRGLMRNHSVQTLELDGADTVDGLKRLLNSNPRITSLTLTNYLRNSVSHQSMAEILEDLALAIDSNTTLLEFTFEHDDVDMLKDPRVIAALTLFDELTARNHQLNEQRRQQLQRVAEPTAGVMQLNEFKRNEDAGWPELNNETATAITSAIDSVLPPGEAQRVLDVLRFADIRQA